MFQYISRFDSMWLLKKSWVKILFEFDKVKYNVVLGNECCKHNLFLTNTFQDENDSAYIYLIDTYDFFTC